MRMKRVVEKCTLSSAAAEFYAFKRAQKIRERTIYDYQRYITSEIMGLKSSDYDMDGQCITIRAEVAKSRNGSQHLTVLAAFLFLMLLNIFL